MDGNTSRLVDNNHIIVFVYHGNGKCGHRGFVSVKCMGNDVPVLDDMVC